MKNLIAIALFLGSAHAFATPAVGDSATYSITASKDTTTIKFTQTNALTAFDKATSEYTVVTTLTDETGASEVQTAKVPEANLPSTDYLTQLMSFCESDQVGGTVKKVTVALGSIDSCEIKLTGENTGTRNIGVVPFGIVKTDYTKTNGVHIVAELTAAHAGP